LFKTLSGPEVAIKVQPIGAGEHPEPARTGASLHKPDVVRQDIDVKSRVRVGPEVQLLTAEAHADRVQ
jgi:hypothetical protein